MEAYQAVMIAVVALLAGALLPVLYQAAATLRTVRAAVTQAGPAIASIQATVERVERITAKLEEGGRLDRALEAVDGLTRTVGKLQETAGVASKLGATVVPAVVAAVQAWRAAHDGAAEGDEGAAAAPAGEGVAP